MKKMALLAVAVMLLSIFLGPTTVFAESNVLDQGNIPGTASSQIEYGEPCGQEFIPALPVLTGVELYLYARVNAIGNSIITINIRPESITQTPIATQSFTIPSNSPRPEDWMYFEFATPVSVISGKTYVLEVDSNTSYHMWYYTTGNKYPAGNMIKQGIINIDGDWSFRTYGIPSSKNPAINVEIDIKPGGNPNSINLKSKGVVPVAILTSMDFDSTLVDPETVEFAGALPVKWNMKDIDGDGDVDIVFHFKTQELNLDINSIEASITGQTIDPIYSIFGADTVNIVNG